MNAALVWSAGVLACETLGVGNFSRRKGERGAARQPPKGTLRSLGEQASSPAKRQASVTFAIGLAALRSLATAEGYAAQPGEQASRLRNAWRC